MSHADFEMDAQLKEIALRVAKDAVNTESHRAWSYEGGDANVLEFASRFLAALPKPEPVGVCDTENRIRWGGNDSSHRYSSAPNWLRVGTHIYTEAPPIQSAQGWQPKELPPLPACIAKGNLGVCYYDGFQMQQYAMRYAELCATTPQPAALADDVVRDAERYRWLRDSENQLTEDDPCVSGSCFNSWFGEELDKVIDEMIDRNKVAIAAAKGEK